MRKVLLVVALLAVVIVATPASAYITNASDLPNGSYAASFENYADFYVPAGVTWASSQFGTVVGTAGSGTPVLFGGNVADLTAGIGVLEDRAIINTNSINSSGSPVWLPVSQQLTGLFYNLTLSGVTVSGTGVTAQLTLDFSPSTRTSPLTGSPGLAGAPAGSGGVLQIYASGLATPFNPDPNSGGTLSLGTKAASTVNTTAPVSTGKWGPAAWTEGSGTSSDTYPTDSQGSLWLEGEFIPLVDASITPVDGDPSAVFEETLNLGSGVGSGVGNVYLTGGTEYPNISSLLSLTVDERVPSNSTTSVSTDILGHTTNYFGTGYWPSDSNDPAAFNITVIPEPATLSLLGFGLAGLLIRRKK